MGESKEEKPVDPSKQKTLTANVSPARGSFVPAFRAGFIGSPTPPPESRARPLAKAREKPSNALHWEATSDSIVGT
jgi:hypothetical protein